MGELLSRVEVLIPKYSQRENLNFWIHIWHNQQEGNLKREIAFGNKSEMRERIPNGILNLEIQKYKTHDISCPISSPWNGELWQNIGKLNWLYPRIKTI